MDDIKKLASAYICVFGFLHIVVIVLGVKIAEFPPWLSWVSLFLCWWMSWVALYLESRKLQMILAGVFSVAWAFQWLQIFTWDPPWPSIQYTVIACMDFIQALSFAIISDVWDTRLNI